jgi:cyclophilin family peptidyl-prolyl cis-trans isomerase
VPSDKRVRQQANKHRMDQLRREQTQRRRRQRFFLGGAIAAVVIVLIAVLTAVLSGGSPKKSASGTTTVSSATTTSTTAPTTTTAPPVSVPLVAAPAKVGCPDLNGSSKHYTHFSAAPPMCINPAKDYTAHMVTDAGTITIKLLAAENPTTVNNFVFLAGYHFFNGTAFHRVCIAFINQGGDPTGTGTGGPGYSFNGGAPKSSSVYTAGALAMANSGSPSSDGSQFFFVVGSGGKELSANYSYFGQVVGGMSVVDKINADGTSPAATNDNCPPKVVHKITSVTITES